MLCDNQEVWKRVGGGRRFNREGTYVYLRLIDADVWQKPTENYKAIILQLKINEFLKTRSFLILYEATFWIISSTLYKYSNFIYKWY